MYFHLNLTSRVLPWHLVLIEHGTIIPLMFKWGETVRLLSVKFTRIGFTSLRLFLRCTIQSTCHFLVDNSWSWSAARCAASSANVATAVTLNAGVQQIQDGSNDFTLRYPNFYHFHVTIFILLDSKQSADMY